MLVPKSSKNQQYKTKLCSCVSNDKVSYLKRLPKYFI